MRISAISNKNYKQNFGSLTFKESATKHLDRMSLDELKQIKKWKSELENTREFDLIISDSWEDDLFIKHSHKLNPHYDSEGPIYPVESGQDGRKLTVAGVDLLDAGDWYFYRLRFKNKERAKEVYSNLVALRDRCKHIATPFEQIRWAVQGVKYLEEGFGHNIDACINKTKGKVVKDELIDLLIKKKDVKNVQDYSVDVNGLKDDEILRQQQDRESKATAKQQLKNGETSFWDKLLAKIGLQRIKK